MAKVRPVENKFKYVWHGMVDEGIRQPESCRIAVIGVGRAGNNTVTKLMKADVAGAECVAVNTDASHLKASRAHHKILIGKKVTNGSGVNGDPRLGRAAVEESRKRVESLLSGVNIVFITAGLGGGTGTGAAPLIAEIAKQEGAITIGVVTMPFQIEKTRIDYATGALDEMRRNCDTVVVIDNNKLKQLVPQLPIDEAFKVADQVMSSMIKGIIETVSAPSLINLNVADFENIVRKGGVAIVSVGESDAPNRAEEAVRNAFRSPLLDASYSGATGALIHVTGDNQMTIEEANRVGEIVTEMMDNHAHVVWGARVNPEQDGKLKVTLVMTGIAPPHIPNRLESITPQLFNLESPTEPEKPLGVKLNLYQMENF